MTGLQNNERDKTQSPLPIPSPYDALPNHERLRKTVDICGKWPWQLVQEGKIPETWSVNLLDELARAVRIVDTTDISFGEFIEKLDQIIEERIPLNKANWSKKLMKTDATAIIRWMTDKKKEAHQQERTTRSKSQAPGVNGNREGRDSRQSLSASMRSGETTGGHHAPIGDKSPNAGHGQHNLLQQNHNDTSSTPRAATAPAPGKPTGRTAIFSPVARLLTSVTNVDAVTPSRKRSQMCNSSPPEETSRKTHRSCKNDGGYRATTDAPALYMVWLSNESAQARQQVELLKDCRTELDNSEKKRADVGSQEQQIQNERDQAREDVQKLTRDEQQHKLAADSLWPIVEQENCPAQYREAFESSEKLLQVIPGDKKRAEEQICEKERQLRAVDRELGLLDERIERLTEEIEGHREVAAQIEKEQRVCDVLLKLVGTGVTGIAGWDSHRLEALETMR
ncbi:hypothetical protein CEP54_014404 [Fusarium duplospermum]|uniref:Uncharacterized protein n=1 Tax=Fusarium duplospermum TaxID=1325734 RepID=A0A428NWH8_9HYPO|nr:hypothetical protein CEP54_014404 [Fusarium duplospermum]